MRINRRTFLQGCCAGIVAMSGSRLGNLSFAATPSARGPIIVSLFLRGGMDALSFLAPHADANYRTARRYLALPTAKVLDLDGYFGLHPSAAPLKELYDGKNLALIPAAGLPDGQATRSHFQAQDYVEYGGTNRNVGGWLGRHLSSAPATDNYAGLFRGVSVNSAVATALSGFSGALAMSSPSDFTLQGDNGLVTHLRSSLRTMYGADAELSQVANSTLDAVDLLDSNPPGDYTPRVGVTYPDNDFGGSLKSLAQLIKMEVGLQGATLDYGGWDTHESQADWNNPVTGYFAGRMDELSRGLAALWADLADHHDRLVVVVTSEFGRRLKENDNRGTDHGHGGLMAVLAGNIVTKKVYGQWPGLASNQLFERNDVRVTTDFRTILWEIFTRKMGVAEAALPTYFPGYTYPGALGFLPAPAPLTSAGMAIF